MSNIYIVSVTFNDAANLRRTFKSVRRHKKHYQRYVVIDGGSTDDTMALCEEYSDIIDFKLSERDRGIYDAMNKAVRIPGLKDNDYLIWINGGDELIEWPSDIEDMLGKHDGAFFGVYLGVEGCDKYRLGSVVIKTPYDERAFSPASTIWHQGFFVRAGYFKRHTYDITVGIQAENLLMSRLIMTGNYIVSQKPVAKFYIGGTSSHYKLHFKSWLKVSDALGFSRVKLYLKQWRYIAKQLIKMFLPEALVYKWFVKKQSRLMTMEGI